MEPAESPPLSARPPAQLGILAAAVAAVFLISSVWTVSAYDSYHDRDEDAGKDSFFMTLLAMTLFN
jgi:hypothetical protein